LKLPFEITRASSAESVASVFSRTTRWSVESSSESGCDLCWPGRCRCKYEGAGMRAAAVPSADLPQSLP
jgi:hypothetical protein